MTVVGYSARAFLKMCSEPEEICFLSIEDLSKAFSGRVLSPVEVTEAYLRRIERLDGRLHSYITVTGAEARKEARCSEDRFARGVPLGPLDGAPVGLKDLYDTAGVRTTAHSRLYADRVPAHDSEAVRRLRRAGAILLGKHALYEFALGEVGPDAIAPPARNPWDLERIPGGSSSGSAVAVAAGLCAGALGSDTGGSIRWPSAFCGVVGLKPTYGLVSRSGLIPLAWTLDHAGPIARTVTDCALLLQAIAGHDPTDATTAPIDSSDYLADIDRGIEGLRVAAPSAFIRRADDLDAQMLLAYEAALSTLERLGARIEEVDLPAVLEHTSAVRVTIMIAEAFAFHAREASARPHLFGPRFYRRLLEGSAITATDYIQAQRGRVAICQAMSQLMESHDLVVMPTNLRPPWLFAEDVQVPAAHRVLFTQLFNVTGQPAISVPCGFSEAGLPIGLQIAARPYEDHLALRAAYAYERATGWHRRRPPLG